MSSKLKLNNLAGGSLSLIVDDALLTDEEFNVSNGGITRGITSTGGWTKFPDGTMMEWGTALTTTADSSNIFSFANTFAVIPIVVGGNTSGTTTFIQIKLAATTTSSFTFGALTVLNASTAHSWNGSIVMNFHAIGRWK